MGKSCYQDGTKFSPTDKYRIYLDQIDREYNYLNLRLGWLLAFEGIILVAYSALITEPKNGIIRSPHTIWHFELLSLIATLCFACTIISGLLARGNIGKNFHDFIGKAYDEKIRHPADKPKKTEGRICFYLKRDHITRLAWYPVAILPLGFACFWLLALCYD
ncbi:MAG: hypothetical protein AAF743_01705 [Planctomycetota bacterium]